MEFGLGLDRWCGLILDAIYGRCVPGTDVLFCLSCANSTEFYMNCVFSNDPHIPQSCLSRHSQHPSTISASSPDRPPSPLIRLDSSSPTQRLLVSRSSIHLLMFPSLTRLRSQLLPSKAPCVAHCSTGPLPLAPPRPCPSTPPHSTMASTTTSISTAPPPLASNKGPSHPPQPALRC